MLGTGLPEGGDKKFEDFSSVFKDQYYTMFGIVIYF